MSGMTDEEWEPFARATGIEPPSDANDHPTWSTGWRMATPRPPLGPPLESPPLCERCGHPIEDHSVFGSEPDPAMLARVTEARFPGLMTSGLYCPHLDMVAGEDYE